MMRWTLAPTENKIPLLVQKTTGKIPKADKASFKIYDKIRALRALSLASHARTTMLQKDYNSMQKSPFAKFIFMFGLRAAPQASMHGNIVLEFATVIGDLRRLFPRGR